MPLKRGTVLKKNMGVITEWADEVMLLRCGPEVKKYGDPYTFVISVKAESQDTALLFGGCGVMYPGMRKEIRDRLRELGFKKARWERICGNRRKCVEGVVDTC